MNELFGYDGLSCYFCGSDVINGRTLCHLCSLDHTEQEVAAKRLIANMLRQKREGSHE